MHIVNTLVPIFALIALGAALRRGGVLSAEIGGGINKLAYWVGLPALLFSKIAAADFDPGGAIPALLVTLIGTVGVILLSWAAVKLFGLHAGSMGTFIQGAFRGNLAYIGLAVILYGFRGSGQRLAAEQAAIFTLAVMVVIYNVLAVVLLLASRHTLNRSAMTKMGKGIAANPLIIACVAGGLYAATGWAIPSPLERSLELLGQFTLPAALLAIGSTLMGTGVRGQWGPALAASLLKVGGAPALGLLTAWLLGAGEVATVVAMVMLSC
ncbi:MAG: AEC family transporter, partial [Planctomycetota bacterium]